MKTIVKIVVSIFLAILVSSCSSDSNDLSSKEFRYLGFEKNVLLPALNERDITFYALSFDTNKNNWELTLTDGTKDIPVTLNTIEETPYGWDLVEDFMQKIHCKVPAFGVGNYTLNIKNKVTGQLHSDVFLVRDNTFDKIKPATLGGYSLGDKSKFLYFQNTRNTIVSDININSIKKIVLENTTTFNPIGLEYIVNNKGKLDFIIPKETPEGVYYLAIYYNSGLNLYFESNLIVFEEQKPVITSINKTTIASGEELILKGNNFRYTINENLIPVAGLSSVATETTLVFNNGNEEREISIGRFEDDMEYNNINSDFTELTFKIPTKEKFYIFSDVDKTYFEGEVYLKSGPYKSDPFTVRIDF